MIFLKKKIVSHTNSMWIPNGKEEMSEIQEDTKIELGSEGMGWDRGLALD